MQEVIYDLYLFYVYTDHVGEAMPLIVSDLEANRSKNIKKWNPTILR